MLGTDIRGIMAEEEEVQRRQEALQSLMSMRERLLRESLEARIKRARGTGDWTNLSPAECANIYKEERVHLRAQLERTRGKLSALKRAKVRAQRIRAAEAASGKKRK